MSLIALAGVAARVDVDERLEEYDVPTTRGDSNRKKNQISRISLRRDEIIKIRRFPESRIARSWNPLDVHFNDREIVLACALRRPMYAAAIYSIARYLLGCVGADYHRYRKQSRRLWPNAGLTEK